MRPRVLRVSRVVFAMAFVALAGLAGCASESGDGAMPTGSMAADANSSKSEKKEKPAMTGSVADNTEGDAPKVEEVPVDVGSTFTVPGRYEITLTGGEWVDEVFPPDTSSFYNYYERKDGMAYFVVRGTIKNISSQPSRLGSGTSTGLACTYRFNDEYDITASVMIEDGNRFDDELQAMEARNMVVFASVSNDIKAAFTNCKATFKVKEETFSADSNTWHYPNRKPIGLYSALFA